MPPWTDRLMTKIRKLYVVRLLMPNGSIGEASASGVGGSFYRTSSVVGGGAHRHKTAAGALRRRHPRLTVQSSEGAESFTNSQSVPDSARGCDANGPAILSVPTSQDSDESCYSVRNSSANEASSSRSCDTVVNGNRGKHTPRMRISESSRVCADTANQKLAAKQQQEHHGSAARLAFAAKPKLAGLRRHRQQFVEADETEMSVPASCTMPIGRYGVRSNLLISTSAKPRSSALVTASSTKEVGEKKELVFAVVVDDDAANSAGAEDAVAAAAAAFVADAASETKPPANVPFNDRFAQYPCQTVAASSASSAHNSDQLLVQDSSSASSALPGMATRVVEFSVARKTSATVMTTATPTSLQSQPQHQCWQRHKKHSVAIENRHGLPVKTKVLIAKRCLELRGPDDSCINKLSGQSTLDSSSFSSFSTSSSSSTSMTSASTGITCAVSTKIAERGRRHHQRRSRGSVDFRRRRRNSAIRRQPDGVDCPAFSRTVEWSDRLVS